MTLRQRLTELADQAVRKLVTALVTYEGGKRLRPDTIERIRAIVSDLILATRQVIDMFGSELDDDRPTGAELADTRPTRTRPPPPPPKANR